MDKLRKKIIKYFLLCTLGISLVQQTADALFQKLFDKVILPKYEASDNAAVAVLSAVLYIVLSLFILLFGAYVFYRLVRKAVNAESRRRAEEQNMLYSCIAHDLKTPMTSVQGFAAALRDGKIKEEEQGEICDIIYLKTKHMSELVDTLSAYSKLGTEDFSLNLDEADICTVVRDTAAMNYADFESKGIEMNIDIPDEPVMFSLDIKEFARAINNVIVNASKHNESGCEVLIRVHTEDGRIFVTVADTGRLIPKELVPALFDPFVCGNASRTSGTGSGLGLAVSARIAEKHGMTLSYRTDIEGYTKGFVFEMRN